MPIELRPPENAETLLKEPAGREYSDAVHRYAKDLLREADRLEAANRGASCQPEITSTMVQDADILLRRGYTKRPKKPFLIGTQIVATLGSLVTGLLIDAEKLKDTNNLILFILVLTITITATVIAVVKE